RRVAGANRRGVLRGPTCGAGGRRKVVRSGPFSNRKRGSLNYDTLVEAAGIEPAEGSGRALNPRPPEPALPRAAVSSAADVRHVPPDRETTQPAQEAPTGMARAARSQRPSTPRHAIFWHWTGRAQGAPGLLDGEP